MPDYLFKKLALIVLIAIASLLGLIIGKIKRSKLSKLAWKNNLRSGAKIQYRTATGELKNATVYGRIDDDVTINENGELIHIAISDCSPSN